MKQLSSIFGLALLLPCIALPAMSAADRTAPATFYVDSVAGSDTAPGTSEAAAWQSLDKINQADLIPGDTVLFKRGGLWRGQLIPHSGGPGKPITYSAYGSGEKPVIQGSVSRDRPEDWIEVKPGIWATQPLTPVQKEEVIDFECLGVRRAELPNAKPINRDVGIFIGDHGREWGIKKWATEELKNPLDYWYDPKSQRVFVACEQNPAKRFRSIELALTTHIISQGRRSDLIYDGLAVRYGGAHGFGGGGTKRITIRNCDVYWIGGGLQFFKPDGKPVRFGNGIEFWGAAEDHLVENNRLWEIYDAALTNQGKGANSIERNITYRNNVIWNAEYSFEYWNGPKEAITENILFENNTCVDAGFCWSHAQRPNPNGAHLMFYDNPAKTKNVVIRNNLFVNSTEVCARFWSAPRPGIELCNNLYWQTDGKPFVRVEKAMYAEPDFAAYQSALKQDAGSVYRDPRFMDSAQRDYRLKEKSSFGAQK